MAVSWAKTSGHTLPFHEIMAVRIPAEVERYPNLKEEVGGLNLGWWWRDTQISRKRLVVQIPVVKSPLYLTMSPALWRWPLDFLYQKKTNKQKTPFLHLRKATSPTSSHPKVVPRTWYLGICVKSTFWKVGLMQILVDHESLFIASHVGIHVHFSIDGHFFGSFKPSLSSVEVNLDCLGLFDQWQVLHAMVTGLQCRVWSGP